MGTRFEALWNREETAMTEDTYYAPLEDQDLTLVGSEELAYSCSPSC